MKISTIVALLLLPTLAQAMNEPTQIIHAPAASSRPTPMRMRSPVQVAAHHILLQLHTDLRCTDWLHTLEVSIHTSRPGAEHIALQQAGEPKASTLPDANSHPCCTPMSSTVSLQPTRESMTLGQDRASLWTARQHRLDC